MTSRHKLTLTEKKKELFRKQFLEEKKSLQQALL